VGSPFFCILGPPLRKSTRPFCHSLHSPMGLNPGSENLASHSLHNRAWLQYQSFMNWNIKRIYSELKKASLSLLHYPQGPRVDHNAYPSFHFGNCRAFWGYLGSGKMGWGYLEEYLGSGWRVESGPHMPAKWSWKISLRPLYLFYTLLLLNINLSSWYYHYQYWPNDINEGLPFSWVHPSLYILLPLLCVSLYSPPQPPFHSLH